MWIGNYFYHYSKYDEALQNFNQAINFLLKVEGHEGISSAFLKIASIYRYTEKDSLALQALRKSLKYSDLIGSRFGEAQAFSEIGKIYLKWNLIDSADYYISNCYQISKDLQYPSLIAGSSQAKSQYFEKKQNFSEALKYYKVYKVMSDSVRNDETQKSAIRQKMEYDFNKQKSLQAAELEKQILIRNSFIVGFGLVLMLAVVIFKGYKQKKKANEIITKQKNEVNKQKDIVEEKNREILDSITYAKRLQEAILPPSRLVKEYFQNSFILYKPKDIVAGDFYWLETIHLDEKKLRIIKYFLQLQIVPVMEFQAQWFQ